MTIMVKDNVKKNQSICFLYYEGQSKYPKTVAITSLLNVISLLNLKDIIKQLIMLKKSNLQKRGHGEQSKFV